MVVLLLDDRPDNFFGRNCRGDGPQPTSILSPDRLVKVQRDDLENTGGNTTEVGKRFDCIGGLPDQPLSARIADFRQVAGRSFANARPGAGPKAIGKRPHQVFVNIEAHFNAPL